MSDSLLNALRNQAFSYVYIQAAVIICITILLYICGKTNASWSFFLGGVICVVPNAYFAHKFFARTGAQAVRQIIKSFYLGELLKYVLTFLLFALVFKLFKTDKLAIFIGYIVAQFTFWFTAMLRSLNG